MVFRMKGKLTFQVRVTSLDSRRSKVLTTGTPDEATARDVGAFVRRLRARRNARALDALLDDRVSLPELYDADVAGRLDEALAAAYARPSEADDPDLAPLVAEWAKTERGDRRVQRVRRLIPEGARFPRSRFRRKAIRAFLDGLTTLDRGVGHGVAGGAPASPNTKNAYRSALRVFADWLIEREVLEVNPVRDVKPAPGAAARTVHYSPAQARAIVDRMAGVPRVCAALMAGTGMEWQSVRRLLRRDVDLETRTAFARGTKTRHRARYVEITEAWAWAVVEPYLRTLAPSARVVPLSRERVLQAQREAADALGLPHHTLHDWRHTYSVIARKRGDAPQIIKQQLGHSPNSTTLERVYGAYVGISPRVAERLRKEGIEAAPADAADAPKVTARVTARKRRMK